MTKEEVCMNWIDILDCIGLDRTGFGLDWIGQGFGDRN